VRLDAAYNGYPQEPGTLYFLNKADNSITATGKTERPGLHRASGAGWSCSSPWGRRSRCFRRSLGAALWTLVGLLAGFLGALSSLVGTGAGRALLARVSEGALRQAFTGTMEIGDVRGSLLTGLTLSSEVRLFDADTTLVAWLPQVNVSYNPFDFAAGRVVLFEFDLRRPVINIVQHPSGRLNIEELFRLGGQRQWTARAGHPDPVSERSDHGRDRDVAPAGEARRTGRLEPRDRERRHQRTAPRPPLRAPRRPLSALQVSSPARAGHPHRHLAAGHGEL